MNSRIVVLLEAAIGAALLASLFVQIVALPGAIRGEAQWDPLIAQLQTPLIVIGVLGILCGQILLIATARLLLMTRNDQIFSKAAYPWVNVLIGSVLAAGVVSLGASVAANSIDVTPDTDMSSMGLFFGGILGACICACIALVIVVMRGLLKRATGLQDEMATVV